MFLTGSYSIIQTGFSGLEHPLNQWMFSNTELNPLVPLFMTLFTERAGESSALIDFLTSDDLETVGAGFARLAVSPAFHVLAGAIRAVLRVPCLRTNPQPKERDRTRSLRRSCSTQSSCSHHGPPGKLLDIFVGYPGSVLDAVGVY